MSFILAIPITKFIRRKVKEPEPYPARPYQLLVQNLWSVSEAAHTATSSVVLCCVWAQAIQKSLTSNEPVDFVWLLPEQQLTAESWDQEMVWLLWLFPAGKLIYHPREPIGNSWWFDQITFKYESLTNVDCSPLMGTAIGWQHGFAQARCKWHRFRRNRGLLFRRIHSILSAALEVDR